MKPYVGSVGYSSVEIRHLMSLMSLRQLGVRVDLQAKLALWEFARSLAASNFVRDEESDVLLLVETDVAFAPADVARLCQQALTYDIVGAACGDSARDACWVDDAAASIAEPGAPTPVRWLGSGMVAIHRRVLGQLCKRPDMPLVSYSQLGVWPFFYPMFIEVKGQRIAAGDMQAFCERAREEGFGVHVDVAVGARRVAETAADPIDTFIRGQVTPHDSKEATNGNNRARASQADTAEQERARRAQRFASATGGGPSTGVGGDAASAARPGQPVLSRGRRG